MSSQVRYIRELESFKARQCLVEVKPSEHAAPQFFVVSSASVPFVGPGTLAFRSDEDGVIDSYIEVAGGRGASRDDVLAELARVIDR